MKIAVVLGSTSIVGVLEMKFSGVISRGIVYAIRNT